ncbi:hypothetical protein KIN20_037547 [Parelaphostrongylus tenuis]|uniref:Uncharacterized protein n=1 Tax=Parelaphostrongylus tenuis TaxID=148309 RepID=A0AAD5WLD9_PARTN|nr:hypothetical protein KIN20_037547 [Parelaphostrongylus tenuis]
MWHVLELIGRLSAREKPPTTLCEPLIDGAQSRLNRFIFIGTEWASSNVRMNDDERDKKKREGQQSSATLPKAQRSLKKQNHLDKENYRSEFFIKKVSKRNNI